MSFLCCGEGGELRRSRGAVASARDGEELGAPHRFVVDAQLTAELEVRAEPSLERTRCL